MYLYLNNKSRKEERKKRGSQKRGMWKRGNPPSGAEIRSTMSSNCWGSISSDESDRPSESTVGPACSSIRSTSVVGAGPVIRRTARRRFCVVSLHIEVKIFPWYSPLFLPKEYRLGHVLVFSFSCGLRIWCLL